jgi:hypothetical protein
MQNDRALEEAEGQVLEIVDHDQAVLAELQHGPVVEPHGRGAADAGLHRVLAVEILVLLDVAPSEAPRGLASDLRLAPIDLRHGRALPAAAGLVEVEIEIARSGRCPAQAEQRDEQGPEATAFGFGFDGIHHVLVLIGGFVHLFEWGLRLFSCSRQRG